MQLGFNLSNRVTDTFEFSSILIYFALLSQAFWYQIKLGKLKDSFEES
jgi:hypothetical protein